MFKVYSVYDIVSKRSVFITMNYNDDDASRSFEEGLKHIPERASSLELQYIGTFDPCTLKLTGVDTPVLVAEGIDYDFESEVN